MTVEVLEKIFGSSARLRIMKLFLFNKEEIFDKGDISKKAKVTPAIVTKELRILTDVGFIKSKSFFKEVKLKSGLKKKRVNGFVLDPTFIYLNHFKNLLLNTEPMSPNYITRKLSRGGRIKLIVLAGVFIKADDSRIDLMVVGDSLKETSLRNAISQMEAEIGKELRYTILTTEDFKYRQSICDRLVRDLFDYQHRVIVDKIGL